MTHGHAVVPVHQAPRAVVEDIVANGILAGDRLEEGRGLLDPTPYSVHMIPLYARQRQRCVSSAQSH